MNVLKNIFATIGCVIVLTVLAAALYGRHEKEAVPAVNIEPATNSIVLCTWCGQQVALQFVRADGQWDLWLVEAEDFASLMAHIPSLVAQGVTLVNVELRTECGVTTA